jgi:hypothetical protein
MHKLEFCLTSLLVTYVLLSISSNYDQYALDANYINQTFTVKNINVVMYDDYVKHPQHMCLPTYECAYLCDFKIKHHIIGCCYDNGNVSCGGYYYWIDNDGYMRSILYDKGERNYHLRSVIMKEHRWNITVFTNMNKTYIGKCNDYMCLQQFVDTYKIGNNFSKVFVRSTGHEVNVIYTTSYTTACLIILIYIEMLSSAALILS